MRFRPCIDLHAGRVKQIVGSTLSDVPGIAPLVNFEADMPPGYYAKMYRADGLSGGHVIMLGPGNEDAARDALEACPGFLQIGGGIDDSSAGRWLAAGASKVIVTSFIFSHGELSMDRLQRISTAVGREKLVLDLSCRRREGRYLVACDRWQTFTSFEVCAVGLRELSQFCSEFLVHAVDVEGKQCGMDEDLAEILADAATIPVTYAGGISSWREIDRLARKGRGRLDFTVGSALDIFGGRGLKYIDLVHWQRDGMIPDHS